MADAFQPDAFQQDGFQIEVSASASAAFADFAGFLLAWKRRRIKKRHAQLREVAEVVSTVLELRPSPASTGPQRVETEATPSAHKEAQQGQFIPSFDAYVIAEQLLKTDTLENLRKIERADQMLKRIEQALEEIDDEEVLLLIN